MKFRNLIFICIVTFFTITTNAQDYIDIFKVNYASILNAGYENSDATTNINILDASLTYPIKVNERFAIISGIDYVQHGVEVVPNGDNINLNTITLKAGVNIKHNEKWSGTYVFLPKIASQDLHTDGDHLFFGGLALLKYQKSERMQYRFGAYASSEGFGTFLTPILGMYYQSEDKRWEISASLPINADINYHVSDDWVTGVAFQAFVRTFSLDREATQPELYIQMSNIEIGPYIQYGLANESILLRLQAGYSTASYEVFEEGDTLPIRVSAFEFGDDRNLLNPEMTGNLFLRFGAVYRFSLK